LSAPPETATTRPPGPSRSRSRDSSMASGMDIVGREQYQPEAQARENLPLLALRADPSIAGGGLRRLLTAVVMADVPEHLVTRPGSGRLLTPGLVEGCFLSASELKEPAAAHQLDGRQDLRSEAAQED